MTQKEWEAWSRETKRSEKGWVHDHISEANRSNEVFAFIYHGGENGQWIQIFKNGYLELGSYRDAVPHIGEAFFTLKFKRKYSSPEAAVRRLAEGLPWLLAMLKVKA